MYASEQADTWEASKGVDCHPQLFEEGYVYKMTTPILSTNAPFNKYLKIFLCTKCFSTEQIRNKEKSQDKTSFQNKNGFLNQDIQK